MEKQSPKPQLSHDAKTIIVVLLLVLSFPIGLIFMWLWMKTWPKWAKILLTAAPLVFVLFFVLLGFAFYKVGTSTLQRSEPKSFMHTPTPTLSTKATQSATANWKTFVAANLYSIKYPPNLYDVSISQPTPGKGSEKVLSPGIVSIYPKRDIYKGSYGGPGVINIRVEENGKNLTLDNPKSIFGNMYTSRYSEEYIKDEEVQEILLDDKKAYEIDDIERLGISDSEVDIIIMTIHNNKVFEIWIANAGLDEDPQINKVTVRKILQTFTFD